MQPKRRSSPMSPEIPPETIITGDKDIRHKNEIREGWLTHGAKRSAIG